jgi:CPA2 family monovalent cation:H+ antiporter-2
MALAAGVAGYSPPMLLALAAVTDIPTIFIELGAAIIGLAILGRLASRWGFSAIPLYLLAGLAFGNGGLLPLNVSQGFVHIGAEIGVVLLLFMLGLEYTGEELGESLRTGLPAGAVDFALNFSPGFAAGLLLGWGTLAAVLLGGVTWISSSGVIAKVLAELGRMDNPETPVILSVLVLEDLAMAIYLPLVSVLLVGRGLREGVVSVLIALATVGAVLFVAVRFGKAISRVVAHQSDEIILLSTFGLVLLVAGVAQRLQVSAAVGAFLVGIALTGAIVEQTRRTLAPLRDLFAATFFFFFGLEIDPASLPKVLPLAAALGAVTALTKLATGWWAARRAGIAGPGRWRAGAALTARGEFSIVIAGLGVSAGLEPRLGPLSAAYVLLLAVAGPILARFVAPSGTSATRQ